MLVNKQIQKNWDQKKAQEKEAAFKTFKLLHSFVLGKEA